MSTYCHLKPLIISGYSSQDWAAEIAAELGSDVVKVDRKQYDDREISVTLQSGVRGYPVVVVASASGDPSKQEKEARLLMDAARESSAKSITLVLPYMWYGRSDDTWDRRNSPALVDTIRNLRSLCDGVVVVDPHNAIMTSALFKENRKNCTIIHFAYPWAVQLNSMLNKKIFQKENLLFAHADAGGIKRITPSFRTCLYGVLGYPDRNPDEDDWGHGIKDRNKETGEIKINGFSANVIGKDVVIFEDMISSGGTACETATYLKQAGARSVNLFATNGLFTRSLKKKERTTAAIHRINHSDLDSVFITDTYSHKLTDPKIHAAVQKSPVIHVVKTAGYMAAVLRVLHRDVDEEMPKDANSISALARGYHPDQLSSNTKLVTPVCLKPSNPLVKKLKHAAPKPK